MRSLSIPLMCGFVFFLHALAEGENTKPDLSTPERTIESFFSAVKADDVEAVVEILSGRLTDIYLNIYSVTYDEYHNRCRAYMKAWDQYPVVKIGKAIVDPSNKHRATTEVIFLINGKEYPSQIDTTLNYKGWHWDGNWGRR